MVEAAFAAEEVVQRRCRSSQLRGPMASSSDSDDDRTRKKDKKAEASVGAADEFLEPSNQLLNQSFDNSQ